MMGRERGIDMHGGDMRIHVGGDIVSCLRLPFVDVHYWTW
jgi:hypothetical protein